MFFRVAVRWSLHERCTSAHQDDTLFVRSSTAAASAWAWAWAASPAPLTSCCRSDFAFALAAPARSSASLVRAASLLSWSDSAISSFLPRSRRWGLLDHEARGGSSLLSNDCARDPPGPGEWLRR